MFKVHNKNSRTTDVVPVSLLLTLIVFSSFPSISTVDLEQANVCCLSNFKTEVLYKK